MKRVQFVLQPVALALIAGLCLPALVMAEDPDPGRFAKAINWFAASDRKSAPPNDAVLFVGSSSIVQWQTAEAFPHYPVLNRGFGGSHISDVLHHFDRVVRPYDPSVIVFYCGDNDIAAGKTPGQVLQDFAEFRRRVRASFGQTPLIYLPIKPSTARWEFWRQMAQVNVAIKKQAANDPTLVYAGTAAALMNAEGKPDASLLKDDGLHLNEAGYKSWNAVLRPILAEYAGKRWVGPMLEDRLALRYLTYLPEGYESDAEKRWPLVLFLHGSGERGSDLSKVALHGPPKLIKAGQQYPFIMIAPQCPNGRWFRVAELVALLDDVEERYRVDPQRIYVTGLSMGGFGTFQLAMAIPQRLAAAAPICGGGTVQLAPLLKDLPLWAFHGSADQAVPAARSREMIEAINAAGGQARLTIYPGVGHDSWTRTYADPQFWRWLLAQKREQQKAGQ